MLMNKRVLWMRRTAGRGCATLLAVALAAPAAAQLPGGTPGRTEVPTGVGVARPAPQPVVADGELRLSLDDAIEIALRQNLDLSLERYDRTASALFVRQNLGIFDLRSFANIVLTEDNQPNASGLEGAAVLATEARSFALGLDQLTAWGGQASLRLDGSRQSSNSTNALIDPQFGAGDSISFTQPLLRGFGELATKRPILLARIGSEISREAFEQEATRVIQEVERAYWSLVEAQDQLGVAQESRTLARELHDRNRVQVEVGTLAPIELVQSEATMATREEEIIRARTAVGDTTDLLLQLLNLDRAAYWDLEVVPTTEPETERLEIDLQEAIRTALEKRPELALQALNIESTDLDRRFFQREKLPTVDLVLAYGSSGLAGRGVVFDPETNDPISVDTDLSDAFSDAFGFDFDGWTLRLDAAYPIQNRSARAQAEIAALDSARSRTELERLELQVVTEVRAAARAVESAAQQIEAARVSRRLQERNLDAEQRRYENGMSTSFQVTEIQEDLTIARSREVAAVAGYRNALAQFYRVTGTLLEVSGVELVEEGVPDVSGGWRSGNGGSASNGGASGAGEGQPEDDGNSDPPGS
jgi:outer membrane protein TolC